jgi:hypothetical protein
MNPENFDSAMLVAYLLEFLFLWGVLVLIYWPFLHWARGGDRASSLRISALVQLLTVLAEAIVYNVNGAFYFERLFPQTPLAQEIAKGLYLTVMAIVATIITVAIIRPRTRRSLFLLWAGHQLIATLSFLVNFVLGVEF